MISQRWFCSSVCVVATAFVAPSSSIGQDIIPFGAQWRYLVPQGSNNDPSETDINFEFDWTLPEYDDTSPLAWSGPATGPLAYGIVDGIEPPGTLLTTPPINDRYTAYFRHEFETTELLDNLHLEFLVDDSGVFYLDGVEIDRHNCCIDELGDEAPSIFFSFGIGAANETAVVQRQVLVDQELQPGQHVFSASVHQRSTESSDLGFNLRFFNRVDPKPHPTPDFSYITPRKEWRYKPGRGKPSASALGWTEVNFNDNGWEKGIGGFGYDTNESTQDGLLSLVQTELIDMQTTEYNEDPYTTVYLRKSFVVDDPSLVDELALTLDYDDSFVAYVNGTEIARSDFGTPGEVVHFDAVAGDHESTNGVEAPFNLLERFAINLGDSLGLLQEGDNVLAIQGINRAPDSSDFLLSQIGFGGFMSGARSSCDFNADGLCNVDDMSTTNGLYSAGDLAGGIAAPPADTKFDLNSDSTINAADLHRWLEDAAAENGLVSPYLKGDTNLDGDVDFSDFVTLSNNFRTGKEWSDGNFHGGGTVAFGDFVTLSNNFGKDTLASVPEPNSIHTFILGLGGLIFVTRVTFRTRQLQSLHSWVFPC